MNNIIPRSVLYNLEPIGIGSPECECLLSYWTRLAIEYCTSIQKLTEMMVDLLHPNPSNWQVSIINWGVSRRCNTYSSQSRQAEWIANLLNQATGRSDLLSLTLIPWRPVFKFSFVRRELFYCPLCFSHQQSSKTGLYIPLLWCIFSVRSCHKHKCILRNYCPICRYTSIVKWSNLTPGYCSNCGAFLGSDTDQLRYVAQSSIWDADSCRFAKMIEQNSDPVEDKKDWMRLLDLISPYLVSLCKHYAE